MYYIFNLDTEHEIFVPEDIPRKQALKVIFALNKGLAAEVENNFGEVMESLEKDILETANVYSLGKFTVLKK